MAGAQEELIRYPAGLTVVTRTLDEFTPWLELSAMDEVRLGGELLAVRGGERLQLYRLGEPRPFAQSPCPGDWDLAADGSRLAFLGRRLEIKEPGGKTLWSAAAPTGHVFLRGEVACVTTSTPRGEQFELKAHLFDLATGKPRPAVLLDRVDPLTGFTPEVLDLWDLQGGWLVLSNGRGSQVTFVDGRGPHRLSTQSYGDHDWVAFSRNRQYFLWETSMHPGDRTFAVKFFQSLTPDDLKGRALVETTGYVASVWDPIDAQGGRVAYGYDQCLEVLDQRQARLVRVTLPDASSAKALAFGQEGRLTVVMSSGKVYSLEL